MRWAPAAGGFLLPLIAALMWTPPLHAGKACPAAAALTAVENTESALRNVVQACPDYAPALNNLAVLLENAGHLSQAESLYQRAIAADPAAIAPYAGLGDVLKAQGRHQRAADAYAAFLARLETAQARGTAGELSQYESLYRERLAALPVKHRGAAQVVRADEIMRSLTEAPARTRGLSLQSRSEPHINIRIHFDFDSARLRPDTAPQIEEIARALTSEKLRDRYIVIEGHTDSTGTESYNRKLSIRRAAEVRLALMAHGIAGHRLSALGFGESRPIAVNSTAEGQASNRRVTFVNMGKR